MRFDSLINGTDSVAVEKAAATQAAATPHRVAADCSSACGNARALVRRRLRARWVPRLIERNNALSMHGIQMHSSLSPIQPNQNLIREIRVICGAFQAFRVTAGQISRSTWVNGQK